MIMGSGRSYPLMSRVMPVSGVEFHAAESLLAQAHECFGCIIAVALLSSSAVSHLLLGI